MSMMMNDDLHFYDDEEEEEVKYKPGDSLILKSWSSSRRRMSLTAVLILNSLTVRAWRIQKMLWGGLELRISVRRVSKHPESRLSWTGRLHYRMSGGTGVGAQNRHHSITTTAVSTGERTSVCFYWSSFMFPFIVPRDENIIHKILNSLALSLSLSLSPLWGV